MSRAYGSVKCMKMYKFRRNEKYCSNGFQSVDDDK